MILVHVHIPFHDFTLLCQNRDKKLKKINSKLEWLNFAPITNVKTNCSRLKLWMFLVKFCTLTKTSWSPSSPLSLCTLPRLLPSGPDGSQPEEETKTQDHLHRGAARATRSHIWEDSLPRCDAERGTCHEGGPQGGESRGEHFDLSLFASFSYFLLTESAWECFVVCPPPLWFRLCAMGRREGMFVFRWGRGLGGVREPSLKFG